MHKIPHQYIRYTNNILDIDATVKYWVENNEKITLIFAHGNVLLLWNNNFDYKYDQFTSV